LTRPNAHANRTTKVYVVTGGSAGIGFGIVAHLLSHKAEKIYLLSNKEEHAEEAQESLKKYGDVSRVEWKKCNLEDLKFTNDVARELRKLDRLDGVSNLPLPSKRLSFR
jgi:WW domain-containing oxidoreductase